MYTGAEITIIGHIGKDPVKPSSAHPDFITFSLATQHKDKKANSDITTWYNCKSGSKSVAEFIEKNIKAGMGIEIRGIPTATAYQEKTTNALRARIEVALMSFPKILKYPPKNESTEVSGKPNNFEDLDDNIPF